MADTKLVDLTETSVVALDDVIYTVDVSDTTDAATGSSRKLSMSRGLGILNNVCQGRLTLSTGNAVYTPVAATPSSTDTGAETTTFATAHGWTTGTMATPSATGGGLTAGTTYYLNATSSTACSYHTTLANAEAGTSKVDLTASITAEIRPFGVQSTTIRFTPYNGNLISIYDGTRWKLYAFSELSLALGTLTSGKPYDVFIYDNSGTLTLEFLVWTNDTTRATALVLQDGIYVKTGATTRRYLGTFYTISTTVTEDSFTKRVLWNMYNREWRTMGVRAADASSWTYNSTTWHAANGGDTSLRLQFLIGVAGQVVMGDIRANASAAGIYNPFVSFGEDSTSAPIASVSYPYGEDSITITGFYVLCVPHLERAPAAGFHYWQWIEKTDGSITFYGSDAAGRNGGIFGKIET